MEDRTNPNTALREKLQDYAVRYIQALEDDNYDFATKLTTEILALIQDNQEPEILPTVKRWDLPKPTNGGAAI